VIRRPDRAAGRARRRARAAALAGLVLLTAPARGVEADPFAACRGCHEIGPGARNGIGPHLDGLIGRPAASIEGFAYSGALRRLGAEGLVWTAETLDAYLARPASFAPGLRMSFDGVDDPAARAALIAWIGAASAAAPAADPNAPAPPREEMAAAALALDGDAAYGEFLAGECVGCHQATGRADGIPSIVGWPRDAFVRALFAYKTNVRSHEIMRSVTNRLGDEEIAALAAYFGGLTPQ
jgi:cytochrome c